MRETTCLLLGEEQLVVDGDLEDPSGTLDELRLDPELLLDLLRQTGGAGVVVSDAAVLNDDSGSHDRLLSTCIIPPHPPGPRLPGEAQVDQESSCSREE